MQSHKQNTNLLFSKSFNDELKDPGDYLIRVSTSDVAYYTIDCKKIDKTITSARVFLEQLNEFLADKQYITDKGEVISLLNHKLPKDNQVCTTRPPLVFSKISRKVIHLPIVGNYLRIVDDLDLNDAIFTKMRFHQSPPIIIHRIEEPPIDQIAFIVNNQNDCFSACYEAFYLQENGEIASLKFITFTNNPTEINLILSRNLINPISEVKIELFAQDIPVTKCGFAYLHQNKQLYPEEYYLTRSENKIVAIQTPQLGTISGNFKDYSNTPNGATSGAIYRILNNPKFPSFEKEWIIITGHGYEDKPLSGDYESLTKKTKKATASKPEMSRIECKAFELANLIMQSGYQPGSHINLLLYVCYGGRSGVDGDSYAKQLAWCLAEKGIYSNIVASKKAVNRFSGKYEDGEKEGECLRYRVDGTPDDIVVVTGAPSNVPGEYPIIEEKLGQYPNGFYITSKGLGAPDQEKRKELIAKNIIKKPSDFERIRSHANIAVQKQVEQPKPVEKAVEETKPIQKPIKESVQVQVPSVHPISNSLFFHNPSLVVNKQENNSTIDKYKMEKIGEIQKATNLNLIELLKNPGYNPDYIDDIFNEVIKRAISELGQEIEKKGFKDDFFNKMSDSYGGPKYWVIKSMQQIVNFGCTERDIDIKFDNTLSDYKMTQLSPKNNKLK